MKKEYWKPVVGYEGLYEVSNWGRVKSLKFGKEKILKNWKNNKGYCLITLSKNGKRKHFLVHRLVAEAFLQNNDNLPCVNHKDENPQNNNVNNLEWCTNEYNHNYGTINKRISKSLINGKCSKIVLQYNLDGTFVREWSSTMECDRNGFCNQNVSACCRGKLKKYKDFIWEYKYKNEEDN